MFELWLDEMSVCLYLLLSTMQTAEQYLFIVITVN